MTSDRPRTIAKRSLTIAGHATSISLEDSFWAALADCARARALSLPELVALIDQGRDGANLSSAIRVFLLAEARAGRLQGTGSGEGAIEPARSGADVAQAPKNSAS